MFGHYIHYMLWLIGLGINGAKGISIYALDILKSCDTIYAERFSSLISEDELQNLNYLIRKNNNKKIIRIQRWFLEDGREIIEQAESKNVALLTYGDPLIATTHAELFVRAVKRSLKVKIIHAASGLTALIGETGLHMYKFGRSVTIMSEPQSAISVYNTIFDNLLVGNHTLILTEYNDNYGQVFFLDPAQAFKELLNVEKDLNYRACCKETFAVVVSRLGKQDQKIISGKVESLLRLNYGIGPHSIIVTGLLHFTEADALTTVTCNIDEPSDNPLNVRKISVNMVERYIPKAKDAIKKIRTSVREEGNSLSNKRLVEVIDNAEYYVEDAERFQRTGKLELAILSIGYAEGLIDAIGVNKETNPWV
jgi:diphthine synthase